jgi:glycosyltransferase involved in cell wall biosynthesis
LRVGLDLLSEVAGQSSGTETYLMGFLNALAGLNRGGEHEFFLFLNPGNEEFYRTHVPGFPVVHFPFSSRRQEWRVLSQLSLIPVQARRLRLDVVNFLGTTGAFAVGCATVQHIKTLHHLQYREHVRPRSAMFRTALMGPSARAADIVIANSESTREGIARHLRVPPSRIVTVPEAVDHEIFVPRKPDDGHERTLTRYGVTPPYVLFVSSLWPYKNVHGLLGAYARLVHDHGVPQRLVVVGGLPLGTYREELGRISAREGIGDRVQFLGHVTSRHDIRDLYVGADVFVYPSYAETFGLTVLEAMASGTPVVASNRTSIPEVAGGAAVLVDPDDAGGMSDAILRVLCDPEWRAELVRRGIMRASEFSWERTARETLGAYELAVARRTGGGARADRTGWGALGAAR